jgi:hypothetical protein
MSNGKCWCKHASESFPGVADADGTSMDIERPRWPLALTLIDGGKASVSDVLSVSDSQAYIAYVSCYLDFREKTCTKSK